MKTSIDRKIKDFLSLAKVLAIVVPCIAAITIMLAAVLATERLLIGRIVIASPTSTGFEAGSLESKFAYELEQIRTITKAKEWKNRLPGAEFQIGHGTVASDDVEISLGATRLTLSSLAGALRQFWGMDRKVSGVFGINGDGAFLDLSIQGWLVSKRGAVTDWPNIIRQAAEETYGHISPISLGYYYFLNNRLDEATTLAKATLRNELERDDSNAYTLLGLIESAKGDELRAIDFYSIAISADSNNVEAYYDRGLSYAYIANYAQSHEDIQVAFRMRPTDAKIRIGLATLQIYFRQYDDALRMLRGRYYGDAISDIARNIQYLKSYALVCKPDTALAHRNTRELVDRFDDPRGYHLLSVLAKRNLDWQSKFDNSTRALQFNNADPLAYLGRGEALFFQGNYQEAIQEYSRALTLEKSCDALTMRGLSYAYLGDNAKAQADLQGAILCEPGNRVAVSAMKSIRDEGSVRFGLIPAINCPGLIPTKPPKLLGKGTTGEPTRAP